MRSPPGPQRATISRVESKIGEMICLGKAALPDAGSTLLLRATWNTLARAKRQ
jgi:hypothetical protein